MTIRAQPRKKFIFLIEIFYDLNNRSSFPPPATASHPRLLMNSRRNPPPSCTEEESLASGENKTKTRPRCLPEWRAGQTLVLHLDVDGVLAHCCRRERDVNTRWRPLHLDGDAALVDTCANDTKKKRKLERKLLKLYRETGRFLS